jgi:hypothetical protein
VRAARRPVVWTRYEIFRDRQPQTEIDRAQYTYWVRDKQGWAMLRLSGIGSWSLKSRL